MSSWPPAAFLPLHVYGAYKTPASPPKTMLEHEKTRARGLCPTFWYHKSGLRGLTLNCVPICSIPLRSNLFWQYQPVTLSKTYGDTPVELSSAHINVSVFLFCTTQLHIQSEHSADADAQICGFTSRFSTHTLCQRM